MGKHYSFHLFRISENKGGKKTFCSEKKQKQKKRFVDFISIEDFPIGNFYYMAPPIRTPVNVFERGNWLSLGGGGEFAVFVILKTEHECINTRNKPN